MVANGYLHLCTFHVECAPNHCFQSVLWRLLSLKCFSQKPSWWSWGSGEEGCRGSDVGSTKQIGSRTISSLWLILHMWILWNIIFIKRILWFKKRNWKSLNDAWPYSFKLVRFSGSVTFLESNAYIHYLEIFPSVLTNWC